MSKKSTKIGGFAAQNSGTITNCYSTVELKVKGAVSGGFVGENDSVISKSFCSCKLSKLTGGFVGVDSGNHDDSCYFSHNCKDTSRKFQNLSDCILGQQIKSQQCTERPESWL